MTTILNLQSSFEKMIDESRIDVSINKDISHLKDEIESMKDDVLKRKGDIQDDFAMFFSLDVQKKVLEKMIENVNNAHITMQNPLVAKQAVTVLPLMSYLYSLTKESLSQKKLIVKDKIINLAIQLQNLSLSHNLYTNKEKSISRIQRKGMKLLVKDFARNPGENFC